MPAERVFAMWSRAILKQNAKTALSGKYATAFAACLIVTLITRVFQFMEQGWGVSGAATPAQMLVQPWKWGGVGFLSTLFDIFIGIALTVGLARFFVQNHFGVTDIGTVFSGFRRSYGNTVGAMFVTYLLIGLWTLLFIVPGIVKSLEYCMVKFILSDNPSMPGVRARQISSMMTRGEKGDVFLLFLSFLGWYLLAAVPLMVFSRFLRPVGLLVSAVTVSLVNAYYNAAFAELYIYMRSRLIESGAVNPVEFGLVPPAPPAA